MTSATQTRPGAGSRTPVAERTHPLHRFAGRLHEVLDQVTAGAGTPVWSLGEAELVETLSELQTALPRLTERILALLAHAEHTDLATHLPSGQAATSTAAWWAEHTHSSRPQAHRQLATALALTAHEPTRAALAAGQISPEAARIVTDAVDALPGGPTGVSAEQRDRAERHLLDEARHHDPQALRRLARHLIDVIDPDAADERLARLLAAEEARAATTTRLRIHEDGHGQCHGTFTIPTLHGTILTTALHALANPALPDPIPREDPTASGTPRRLPTAEVLGQAFTRYLELMPAERLPTTGGVNATVVVTIPLGTLEDRLQAASLTGTSTLTGTGIRLSPGLARRLACTAGLIPAVLGTDSTVLDLGRRTRLHTPKQRLAMALRQDGHCAVDGCDRPTTACDAHHLQPWSRGGPTTLDNGILICPRHHTLAHDPRYILTRHNPRTVTLTRRM